MPVFSPKCINPELGFDIQDDGTLKPRGYGYFVKTIEELEDEMD